MTDPTTAPDCGHDAPSLPLDEANARIRAALEPVTERRRVPLRDALGEVLAETIVAAEPVPAHDNSAMDGYALRHADAALDSLRLVGNAFAGHPYDSELGPGECVRIMTGGVVPRGSDAVVMQERVTEADGQVRVQHWPEYGENIRRAGEDLAAGDVILAPGRRITPADLGIIASMGRAEIWVHRPLRVAFFSTGDELRSLGEPLGPGEIFDSNRYSLFGMLSRMGVERVDLGVAPDDRASLSQRLGEAAQAADVIITSGGVSVGEADFMGEILRANGEAHFWSIAMKPGRPLTFGRFQGSWYFGLPGNPVSVMATFTQVVAPALRYLAGEAHPPAPRRFRVPCLSPLRKKPGRQEFQRGRLTTGDDGALAVESVGRQGSGMLRSMSQADCFIVLPAEADDVAAGDWVAVEPFQGPLG
jgi:molybdopterin molybdotransferase